MKKIFKDILNFILKNKYILTFVVIILFLYSIGILKVLAEIILLVLLIILAIYFGKKIQDGEFNIKDKVNSNGEFKKQGNVYYYQEPTEKKSKK